jgi:hypothetical protein
VVNTWVEFVETVVTCVDKPKIAKRECCTVRPHSAGEQQSDHHYNPQKAQNNFSTKTTTNGAKPKPSFAVVLQAEEGFIDPVPRRRWKNI